MSSSGKFRSCSEIARDVVVRQLQQIPNLICLDSDTGLYNGVDFGSAADRFLNMGISEQTMMGAAAGLAQAEMRPIVHTMAAFAASRAVESVKIDIALNNLPVMIVATHGGVSAGHLGPTHHALEDLAVMRTLPNMTVIVPADGRQTQDLVLQAMQNAGPTYIRLSKNSTPDLPRSAPTRLGDALTLRRGEDVAVFACGPRPTLAALDAADILHDKGIEVSVTEVHTIKPLDTSSVHAAAMQACGRVITVEEHWIYGGFGSAVIEALCTAIPVQARRIGVRDHFVHVAGNQQYLLDLEGINAATVVRNAEELLNVH